jgi:putative SOS response-associated peptidase YedK
MCGRFTLTVDPDELREALPGFFIPSDMTPRYNIAPSQPVAVIANDGKNQLDYYVWGLIPSWAKDPQTGNKMINARAETLAEKPSFRNAFKYRRCLILADGFYEWQAHEDRGKVYKTPMYIRMKTGESFAFAGLWEHWHSPDGSEVLSCAIITTEPNDFMKTIHNRMPVILPRESYAQWLEPGAKDPSGLQGLLTAYPSDQMAAFPVSRKVNDPATDSPECIHPVDEPAIR